MTSVFIPRISPKSSNCPHPTSPQCFHSNFQRYIDFCLDDNKLNLSAVKLIIFSSRLVLMSDFPILMVACQHIPGQQYSKPHILKIWPQTLFQTPISKQALQILPPAYHPPTYPICICLLLSILSLTSVCHFPFRHHHQAQSLHHLSTKLMKHSQLASLFIYLHSNLSYTTPQDHFPKAQFSLFSHSHITLSPRNLHLLPRNYYIKDKNFGHLMFCTIQPNPILRIFFPPML